MSRKLNQGGLLVFTTTDGKCECVHHVWRNSQGYIVEEWTNPVYCSNNTSMTNTHTTSLS